jgi:hypothetical protein
VKKGKVDMVPPLPPLPQLPALLPGAFAARPERGPSCELCGGKGGGTAHDCDRESPCKRCSVKDFQCIYMVPDEPKLPACRGCRGKAGFGAAKCDCEVRCGKCMERGIECERDAPRDPAAPPAFKEADSSSYITRVHGRLADFVGAGDGRDWLRNLTSNLQLLQCAVIWPFVLLLGTSQSTLAGTVYDRRMFSALILSLASFFENGSLKKIKQDGNMVQFETAGQAGDLKVPGQVADLLSFLRRVWGDVCVEFAVEQVDRLKVLCKALRLNVNKAVVKSMAEQFELSNKHHLRAVVHRLTLLIGREAARRGNNGNGWHAVRT